MNLRKNNGSSVMMLCLLIAVVGAITMSTALIIARNYTNAKANEKIKTADLQSNQFSLLLTSMRFQINGSIPPVWYPDTYPTQAELKSANYRPLIRVLSPLKDTSNAMTIISEKIKESDKEIIRNYDLDITNLGSVLNVTDSQQFIRSGKSQPAYVTIGDMSQLSAEDMRNFFLAPSSGWPRLGSKLKNLENAKLYFDSYETEKLADNSLLIKGVLATIERGTSRNTATFVIDAPPAPQCKISLATTALPPPTLDCTSAAALESNATAYFVWTDMEHGALTYQRYIAIKSLFPTWDRYGRQGGATSGVAFSSDDDTHQAMCNFMGYRARTGTRVTNSWKSTRDNGAMRFYPATKQFKQVPAKSNNYHTNGYSCVGKLVPSCYNDPTWIAKLPPPPPPPPKPYVPGDTVVFNFTTTSITNSATIENKKSNVDFTLAPQSIRNLNKDTAVSSTGTISLTIPGEAALTYTNPDGTKRWVVRGSVVGVDSRLPASTCVADAINVVTTPDCNSSQAIVSNETTPAMLTDNRTPLGLRYEELRNSGKLPPNSPTFYNPWYTAGDGINIYGDQDTINKSCNILGYARGTGITVKGHRSPGDNAVMKWNPSTKKFDMFNARNYNYVAFWITCSGKLDTRCYNDPKWIFK